MSENITETIFIESYDRFADEIFRFCFFKVSDRELAVDLAQEVFIKFFEYIQKGNFVTNPRALLYRIADHSIIDWYRKKRSVSLDALTEDGFEPPDHGPRTDLHAEVQEALATLSKLAPDDRDIITWRYVNELSPKEIAAMIDQSENVVSVRIHRALKRLQEFLHK